MTSQPSPSQSLDEALDIVWGGALDISTSDDFRNKDGTINEKIYINAEKNTKQYAKTTIEAFVADQVQEAYKRGYIDAGIKALTDESSK